MKDFCKKQQIFFNEGERINFLSQRSKAQYKLYKQAFDHSTTKYIENSIQDKRLLPESSEAQFRKTMEFLRPDKASESKHEKYRQQTKRASHLTLRDIMSQSTKSS